ncbi:MAG: DUF4394 domain-containing protein, partial [Acidobacteria bacterium]|nr:DUF4394 domain-containing protein [Acidobacteriota bacterium]
LYVNNVVATPLAPEDKLAAFIGENPNGTWTLRIFDDGTVDTGSLANWSLTLATPPSAPMAAAPGAGSNNTAQAIPDNAGSITSTIDIAGAGAVIGSLTAFTNITHAFSGDIQATLTSPAGTIVTLTSNNGGGNDNVFAGTTWGDKNDLGNQVPFPSNTFAASNLVTDTVYTNLVTRTPLVPEEALGAFIGENPNGTWTLTVADTAPSDTGTLNSWSLNIATVTCGACSVTCPANIAVSAGAACNAVVTYPAPTTSGTCGTVICSPPSGGTFALGTTTVNCGVTPTVCNTIYAFTINNSFFTFDPATPGTHTPQVTITGLNSGETVRGIDFRPANGVLYGLGLAGSTSRLLTINTTTGAATQVGSTFVFSATVIGFDVNPVADRIRVVSTDGANLRIHPDTGIVLVDTNLNPGNPNIQAVAYSNNVAGATTTTLYGIDVNTDMLVIQSPPNNGTLTNVGPLGVAADPESANFDISPCGVAYASLRVGSNPNRELYSINLATGAATNLGALFGSVLNGLAVAPAPPGTTCAFTVTVNDTTLPVITCPANVTVSAGAACNAVVTYVTPTATDNCPGAVTVTCSPASGSTFALGTTTVTCTATDARMNTATCSFTVMVLDTTPPTITCPADQTIPSAPNGSATAATFAAPTTTDNCLGAVTVTCTPPSGSAFAIGTTTVTCTAKDAANNMASCTFTITVTQFTPVPTMTLVDPLACNGPGDLVNGSASVTNTSAVAQTGTVTTALPPGIVGIPGSCVSNIATCTINATTVSWTNNTIPAGQTLTYNYQAQLANDVISGQVLTATTTAVFGVITRSVDASLTVNCPALGPGLPHGPQSQISDQKPGSVLIYPVYTSDAANGASQNTRLSITNTHGSRGANVHLFFVDGSSCSVADSFICLTANQTASVLASDIDPGTTGYLMAIATDALGCPINFNFLIGDEFVKFASGHMTNLGAEAVSAIAGGLPACDATSVSATLNFNGVSYNLLPRVIASSNLQARADGNDTLLIVDRIGGSFASAASTLFGLFGLMYDDAEKGVSFQIPGASRCQYRAVINNDLRT